MSRGPGALGQRILRELSEAPGHVLPWEELKERFPLQVANKSYYRALRGLQRMGHIHVVDEPHSSGATRHVFLVGFADEADRELLALARAAYRQLAVVARARGVPIPRPLQRSDKPRQSEVVRRGGEDEPPGLNGRRLTSIPILSH